MDRFSESVVFLVFNNLAGVAILRRSWETIYTAKESFKAHWYN